LGSHGPVWPHHIFVIVPGFPTSSVVVFMCSLSLVKMKGDCLFCWYWWNRWPSLFKLSFHKSDNNMKEGYVPYLAGATRSQLVFGGSHFSTIYCVMKLPPSFNGGFHDNRTESSRMFSHVG
jgi:hypothetical protein